MVASDPRKSVLTGAIWPHMDVASEGQAAGLKRLSKLKIKNEISGHCTGGSWFRGLEIMSRLFVNEGNRYFHDPEILQRVIAGLDFAQLMQGANGGFENINHVSIFCPRAPLAFPPAGDVQGGVLCLLSVTACN